MQWRIARFDKTADIFNHDDGIVHDEACRNGESHERKIVEAVAQQIHDAEGANQRQGNGNAGNYGRADAAEEEKDHHHDQSDREHQGELHIIDRSSDRCGAVGEDVHVYRCGKGGLKLREKFFYAIHHGDNICAGLPLNIENDRGGLIGPGGLAGVFHAVDDIRNVAETNRGAIAISDYERPISVARQQLIVRADGERLMQTVKRSLGHVHVGLAEGGAQVLKTQTVGSEGRGIRLNAYGRALSTADTDEADTGKLRDFLGEGRVRQVFHFGQRETRRGKGKCQDGRIRGVDFAVDGRIGQALRKQIRCAIDGRLNFLLGDVNVKVQLELQRDDRATERARRSHLIQPGNLAELTLEGRGDRRGHHFGAGAGIKRLHLNRGVVNLRKRRDR